MTGPLDNMSPESSPGDMKKTGVKRVNNLPLFIALGAFALFVAIIAMVAVKRSESQNEPPVPQKVSRDKNTDTSSMAADIVAGHASGIIPSSLPPVVTETSMAIPVAMIDNPDAPPMPARLQASMAPENPDIERIRQEKTQQFEEAVRAKTHIELPSQMSATHANASPLTGNETEARLAEVRRQLAEMRRDDTTARYQARLQQIRAAMSGGSNMASESKSAFSGGSENSARWALNASIEAPRTPFELRAGAVIPGVMISGVKSSLPGQVIGQVSQNVYDTATGRFLLIPQGTRLVGVYSSDVSYGQDTVMIAWQRLVFPDGKALDMGSMPGADSAGFAGFHDKVNNHYFRTFASATLMSGVVAGVTYSQSRNQASNAFGPPTAGSVMSEALGQQLGQVTAQMIAKNLDIAPTLEIRPGFRFNVMVVKDLTFNKPYQSFDYYRQGDKT